MIINKYQFALLQFTNEQFKYSRQCICIYIIKITKILSRFYQSYFKNIFKKQLCLIQKIILKNSEDSIFNYRLETNSQLKKKLSNPHHLKKLVLLLLVSNLRIIQLFIQDGVILADLEQLVEVLSFKKIVKRFIMLLLIFIALLQELLLIHNLQIYSYHPTYNYKDQIVEDKQGYHHFLLLLVRTLGSGSLNATTILQTKFKDDLLKQQVVQIVIEAIEAVMWIILLSQKVRYKNLEMLKLIQLQHQLTFDKFYDYQSMQLNVNITLTKSQFFFLISKLQLTLIMKSKVQGLTVCKNFRLSKCLGTGAFGEIYLATNKSNQQQMYAAKLQEVSNKNPQLFYEAKIYKYLNSQGGDKGIPKVHAITTEGQYNIMLIDLLGKSLEDLFVLHNKKFTLKTVLFIADQMLQRIQFLHSKQFLHRDIKPDNFLMGRGKKSDKLYLIDLGLSKKYIKDGKHIPYKDGKELTGTARYASINTHIGIQQSRRDDIQSIGYVLMYFLRGILPWQNMKGKDTKQKYHMIMQKKMSTPTEILCKGYPNEFITYLNYAKNMKFQDKPDYTYLRKLFEDVRKRNNIQLDGIYDWNQNNNKITQNVTVKNIIQKPSNNQRIQIKVAQNIPKKELPKDIRVQNISKHKYSNVFGNSNKLPTSKISTINQTTQKVAMISSQKVYGPKISIIKQ